MWWCVWGVVGSISGPFAHVYMTKLLYHLVISFIGFIGFSISTFLPHWGKFFESMSANLCNLVNFWRPLQQKIYNVAFERSGHQKWHGKSTLFRATYKSGTKFTVPAVCGRGAWVHAPMIYAFVQSNIQRLQFAPKPHRGSAPGPRWGTSVPQTPPFVPQPVANSWLYAPACRI